MTCYRNESFGLALEQATQIYAHQTLLSIPSGEEIRKLHQFSDEYRRNMAGLMKGVAGNASRRRRQVYFLNVIYGMRRCAVFLLLSLVLSFMVGMSVEAIRTPLVSFVIEFFEDHVRISTPPSGGAFLPAFHQQEDTAGDEVLEQYVRRLKELGYEEEWHVTLKNITSYEFKGSIGVTVTKQNYLDFNITTIDINNDTLKEFDYNGIHFTSSEMLNSRGTIVYWQIEEDIYYINFSSKNKSYIQELIKCIVG